VARHRTPSRQRIWIALNLMNERAMFSAFAAEQLAVAQDRVVDTLAHIWVSSIYGEGR
jgi:hypothetical protein